MFRGNMFIHTKSIKRVFTIMPRSISEDVNFFINRHFFGYGRELPQVRPKSFNTFSICQSNIRCLPRTKLDLKLTINVLIINKYVVATEYYSHKMCTCFMEVFLYMYMYLFPLSQIPSW